ncbi:class I SAM-dependent methyltransferase [Ekhidna sp.]|uniref:class I SAM-dependent methyltransferase n=1 Tax=Ekhidna sp. TaxID=2608089 RepID=UPI003B5045F1
MILSKLKEVVFTIIDKIFLKVDKSHMYRSGGLHLIPDYRFRRGGKVSYGEWAFVIGIFHTLIEQHAHTKKEKILDVGCGTGLLGISSYNICMNGGVYHGIDVNKSDVEFCEKQFSNANYAFQHFDVFNATYALDQNQSQKKWPNEDEYYDLVTALSVWTHFNESDASFYLKEVSRVLKVDGIAIITFFIIDEFVAKPSNNTKFHKSNHLDWTFDIPAYASQHWKTTKWTNQPEDAIAVDKNALMGLVREANLSVEKYYPGTWKNYPGVYFQDILILKKG